MNKCKAIHIDATEADLNGNQGIGRYIFLPGSSERAAQIAEHFSQVTVKKHSRGHDLHLGKIADIDVAAISSGMGAPSMDIIATELLALGAKRLLRVGTAGTMQPYVKVGSLVVANACVRDDGCSIHYMPIEVPALSSMLMIQAANQAMEKMQLQDKIFVGPIRTKSSLYAREFTFGALSKENQRYEEILHDTGIIASEMETAQLFTLGMLHDHQLRQLGKGPQFRVHVGAILAIIGDTIKPFSHPEFKKPTVDLSIDFAIETVKQLAWLDRQ